MAKYNKAAHEAIDELDIDDETKDVLKQLSDVSYRRGFRDAGKEAFKVTLIGAGVGIVALAAKIVFGTKWTITQF